MLQKLLECDLRGSVLRTLSDRDPSDGALDFRVDEHVGNVAAVEDASEDYVLFIGEITDSRVQGLRLL
jgi:hypothetical protein